MTAIVAEPPRRKPLYQVLYVQVLIGIALAIALGVIWPTVAVQMKPLGDGFIKLIKMAIPMVIFFTVVSGIAGMSSMKQVGKLGGKALLYFEVVSTFALLIGMLVGNWLKPGAGFNAVLTAEDVHAVEGFAGRAQEQHITAFLLDIIPNSMIGAFADGDILPVVLLSMLVGFALSAAGERAKPLRDVIDAGADVIFRIINFVMKLAPIGAFGAMAFTVGRYGVESLGPLLKLILIFYLTSAIFILVVLGAICRWAGFSVIKLLVYIREEILLVLGTSSSDCALPTLMTKLERAGCPKGVVGLVVPTGYVFNTDGTSIYMTLAALFVAQATNTDLTLAQQAAIFGVAILTSKGASGVSGAAFVALVGTLSVIPAIPLGGMALILGIDRFMSECRALTNMIGNAVATVVMSKVNGDLDREQLKLALDGKLPPPVEAAA
ncbi:MAG: dicarboxylate/amino acid:cation symporter [Phenylobacterium sp.]